MIKKFKIKYYITVFVVILLVFVALILSINMMARTIVQNSIGSRLNDLLNYGKINMDGVGKLNNREVAGNTNIIVEYVSEDLIQIYYTSINDTEESIKELSMSVIDKNDKSGSIGSYYYLSRDFNGMTRYAITDASHELALQNKLLSNSIIIFIISIIVVAGIAFLLSKWAIIPIDEAMKKQKQFISDASHELKTPLSVISINSEIIKRETGENQWADSIISETKRMNGLVSDMLTLSQLDEGCVFEKVNFDISETISNVALMLEVYAYEMGRELKYDIQPNVMLGGVESKVKQLAIILIENAIKNSYPNSKILLTLKNEDSNIMLQVENTGEIIPKEYQENIFERFYRVDNSRNLETGGFGLGLCIAKSIADLHKGKISVSSENSKTIFTATFRGTANK